MTLWATPSELAQPRQDVPSHDATDDDDDDDDDVEPASPLQNHRAPPSDPSGIDDGGVAPFEDLSGAAGAHDPPPTIATPFGAEGRRRKRPLDPKTTTIARLDFLVGLVGRIRPIDTLMITSLEVGRMQGFSGSFHTGFLIASDRNFVRALEVPVGVGAVARGRLRNRPGFVSIGLTAGLLVHRAATDAGVVRRVDPDFRVPVRLAWTFATVGLSVALEQGYSVRNRSYDRRGAEVWSRHAYRIGAVIGLHSDFVVRPGKRGSPRGKRGG